MTLHTGFTTGTAAAAAAKAAVIHLLRAGLTPLTCLATGDRMDISTLENRLYDQGAESAVMKDGGDNPDVTHKAVIRARVTSGFQTETVLVGGSGVGMVTRPGLPVPVGLPAINPAPRAQILQAVDEAKTLCAAPLQTGFRVEISVDEGEKLAAETFNPRLHCGRYFHSGHARHGQTFSHWPTRPPSAVWTSSMRRV